MLRYIRLYFFPFIAKDSNRFKRQYLVIFWFPFYLPCPVFDQLDLINDACRYRVVRDSLLNIKIMEDLEVKEEKQIAERSPQLHQMDMDARYL